jgi:carboxyl-terminal processing protease
VLNFVTVNKGMQKGTNRNLLVAASYGGVLLLGLLLGQLYVYEDRLIIGNSAIPLGATERSGKVQRMLELIENSYVDSVNLDDLQDLAIEEIVARLDPHSTYLPPPQAGTQQQLLEGNFEGIGVEYFALQDTLIAIGIIPGGPAHRAGLRPGDRLVRINNRDIAGSHFDESLIERLVKGRRGSTVNLQVWRTMTNEWIDLPVIRERVEVSSLDASYMLDSATAYIKVRRFGVKTVDEFKTAVVALKKQGAKNMLLDLRGNAGGYLHAATELASQFFNDKTLVVYTEGLHEFRTDYFAGPNGVFKEGNVVALIDKRSASGSEIVAGALQDLERGLIIGESSYGKGLVQEQFGFGDGSMLHLTIARYYTPLGRSIQKPYAILKKGNSWASSRVDSVSKAVDFVPSKVFRTASGRIVYENGGISPDIRVDVDSLESHPKFVELVEKSLIEQFVYRHLTQKAPAYAMEIFVRQYHLNQETYEHFITFVNESGVVLDDSTAELLQPLLQNEILSLVGRFFYGSEAYFRVQNLVDPVVIKAKETFIPKPPLHLP